MIGLVSLMNTQKQIEEAIIRRELIPVKVQSMRELLYNSMLERRAHFHND